MDFHAVGATLLGARRNGKRESKDIFKKSVFRRFVLGYLKIWQFSNHNQG